MDHREAAIFVTKVAQEHRSEHQYLREPNFEPHRWVVDMVVNLVRRDQAIVNLSMAAFRSRLVRDGMMDHQVEAHARWALAQFEAFIKEHHLDSIFSQFHFIDPEKKL